jgi:putative lysine transport system substrate-binding protein
MKRLLMLLLVLTMAFALSACGGTPAADDEQNQEGEQNKVLRVAMECAYAPYNWTQPTDENGAVTISGSSDYAYGYDVMMAKHIAEKLGYDLEIVRLKWESIIPAVQTGTVDVAICGQSITSDRLEMVDFSDPYYYASIVVLVPQDGKYANAESVADLAGANVTSQLNTVWDSVCVPQIADGKVLPGQNDAPAMIAALNSGRVDVVVTDQPTALAAVTANPKLKMLEFEGDKGFKVSDEDINIGISMKKGSDDLKAAINSVLADMTEDDFKTMMNEAISVQPLSE